MDLATTDTNLRLLTDAQMQDFVREGYLVMQPEFRPGFHDEIFELLEQRQGQGLVGNNLVPSIPHLRHLLAHADVAGALESILGPDYYLHLHRHNHRGTAGQPPQNLHRDSLYNSRYCIDDRRRHHHARWAMLLYYPQDTPASLGPTVIRPRSQYLSDGLQPIPLEGGKGTVVIIHYDIIHGRGESIPGDGVRHMLKFLFTRLEEPTSASWDHNSDAWDASGDVQEPVWEHMWNWHLGDPGRPTTRNLPPLGDLAARLQTGEIAAAYELARHGDAALEPLLAGLVDERVELRTAAAYGLAALGPAAVSPLCELLTSGDPAVRARGADVLGDLGLQAGSAVAALTELTNDDDAVVRRHAVEALGTTGQALSDVPSGIEALLTDEDAHVRREAALALARLGTRLRNVGTVVPALVRALDDPSHYVRGYAIEALERIGTSESITAALHYLQTTRWDPALTVG